MSFPSLRDRTACPGACHHGLSGHESTAVGARFSWLASPSRRASRTSCLLGAGWGYPLATGKASSGMVRLVRWRSRRESQIKKIAIRLNRSTNQCMRARTNGKELDAARAGCATPSLTTARRCHGSLPTKSAGARPEGRHGNALTGPAQASQEHRPASVPVRLRRGCPLESDVRRREIPLAAPYQIGQCSHERPRHEGRRETTRG